MSRLLPLHGHGAAHRTTATPQGLWLAGAALADVATMLMLPLGAELNPLAAQHPILAIAAKVGITALLLVWRSIYADRVRRFGAIAWTVGAISNTWVLAS